MGLVTAANESMLTTDPPVIVIEDDEIQSIELTTDPASSTTATTRLYEGGSSEFKAVAKPAREDLPLQVRYDVTTLTGVSVSSRLYTLTDSVGSIRVGTGTDAKDNVDPRSATERRRPRGTRSFRSTRRWCRSA